MRFELIRKRDNSYGRETGSVFVNLDTLTGSMALNGVTICLSNGYAWGFDFLSFIDKHNSNWMKRSVNLSHAVVCMDFGTISEDYVIGGIRTSTRDICPCERGKLQKEEKVKTSKFG